MGERLFAAKLKDDSGDDFVRDYDLELSEKILSVFYLTRIDPIDRKEGVGVDVFELSSFKPSGACMDIIKDITEQGLSQEWISPDIVKAMYQLLEKYDVEKAIAEYDGWGSPPEPLEIVELIKFLKACSECNLGIYNPPWYTD